MEMRYLGGTGEKVSAVGLGTWQFSESWGVTNYETAKQIVAKAIEVGMNLIDTAIVYGNGMSEDFVGRAIKELGAREQVFIATKIPGQYLSVDDVLRATRASLRRLRVDAIDLMQVHWPPCWHNFPTCEYMRALERLVNMGLIRYIGLSDFPVGLAEAANSCLAREQVVSLQVRYNLVERAAEKEMLPFVEEYGMSLLAWSPLAQGALTGKYTPDNLPKFEDVRSGNPLFHPKNFNQIWPLVQKLKEIGQKYGKTPAQVALNWLLTTSDAVIVIPGAKRPEHVVDNAGAAGWRLSYEDWLELDQLSKSLRIMYYVED
jgi:aryl-alcohol dehydrogenase-like predicted oxidoreductase